MPTSHYLPWWTWIYTASGQLALFVLIVVLLSFLLRNRSARLRYALWCLVLLKAVTPPIYYWSVGAPPASRSEKSLGPQASSLHREVEKTIQTVSDQSFAGFQAVSRSENAMQTVPFRTLAGKMPADPGAGETPAVQVLAELQAELAQPDYPTFVPTLFAVWLGGMTLFFTVRLARFFVALRMLQRAKELKAGPIWNSYRNLAVQLKLKKPPRLILSSGVKVPFLFGLFRATIVLPATLPEEITASELENVLLHELTHYRRRDLWVNWFEFPVQGIFWFHPFLLGSIFQLRHLREAACDESVLATGATDARAYGKSLLNTLWAVRGRTAHTLGFLGIFERNTHIQNRLENIMQQQNQVKKVGFFGSALLVLVAAVIPFSFARNDTTQNAEKAKRKAEIRQQIAKLQKQLDELEPENENSTLRWKAYRIVGFDGNQVAAEEIFKELLPGVDLQLFFEGNELYVHTDAQTHEKVLKAVETLRNYFEQVKNFRAAAPEKQAELEPENQNAMLVKFFSLKNAEMLDIVKSALERQFQFPDPDPMPNSSYQRFKYPDDMKVTLNHSTRSVIVTAPETLMREVDEFFKKFETSTDRIPASAIRMEPAENPIPIRMLQLENTPAEDIGKTLMKVFPEIGSPEHVPRFAADSHTNSILIGSNYPHIVDAVEALVMKLDQPKKEKPQQAEHGTAEKKRSGITMIPLRNTLAQDVSKILVQIFPDFNATDYATKITVDANHNSLIVVSPIQKDIDIIEALVMQLDQPSKEKPQPAFTTEVYSLKNKSGREVVDHLEKPANDLNFGYAAQENSLIISAPKETHKKIAEEIRKFDQPAPKKNFDAEIEQSLRRKAEFATQLYETVKKQFDVGAVGGTAFNEAQARFHMYRESGKYLAWQYEREKTPEKKAKLRELLDLELKATEDWAKAAQHEYQTGRGTIVDVLAAQAELEDVKIRRLKFEE